MQYLEWGDRETPYGIKWNKDEQGNHLPETAYYVCRVSGCVIDEADKPAMIAAGEWRASKPSGGHAGFHIWAGYSLHVNASWGKLATEWLEVKSDPLRRQTFINLVLGEPYEDRGEKALNEFALLKRCEVWPGEVPPGAAVLTVGADVQDDRLEFEVVGWGRNEESWSVAHEVLEGDPETPELWGRVDAFLKRKWRRADGREFEPMACCIDSGGHHTQRVYEFAKARLSRKIWAIKGESAQGGARSPVWPTKKPSSRNKASFRPVILGVNAAKDVIRSYLHVDEPSAGYCHFPADRDINYFAQLVSERSVLKIARGQKFRVWELSAGRANEALDCRVYAYAALCGLQHFGLRLNKWVDAIVPSYAGVVHQPVAKEEPVPVAHLRQPGLPQPPNTKPQTWQPGPVISTTTPQSPRRSFRGKLAGG